MGMQPESSAQNTRKRYVDAVVVSLFLLAMSTLAVVPVVIAI